MSLSKKTIALIVALVLVLAIICTVVISANSLSDEGEYAVTVLQKYQQMLKDPDSLVLRSNIVFVGGMLFGDDVKFYYYFSASGNNSFGAPVTSIVCFDNGRYVCNSDDFEKMLNGDEDLENADEVAFAYEMLQEWRAYGEDGKDFVLAEEIDAKKVGRKLGIKVNIE